MAGNPYKYCINTQFRTDNLSISRETLIRTLFESITNGVNFNSCLSVHGYDTVVLYIIVSLILVIFTCV